MKPVRLVTRAIVILLLVGAVVIAAVILAFAIQARVRLPELHAWHRMHLRNEYRAGAAGAPRSFEEYRRLEDRLITEVRQRLLDDPAAADTQRIGRYTPHSVPCQLAFDTPYNHSYELVPEKPRGAVLLVHGLSDSPYSMRSLADLFFAQGYYVLVLRLPGHGTIPAGLLHVTWKDWYGAVVLAAKQAAGHAGPGQPFFAGGHSTGAALVTLYSLRALDDASLPKPARLYLVSAAIGITDFAAVTNVIAALSFLPPFEKSKWMDVRPEYDPYKYNSFPVNAANQIYRLTREIRSAMATAGERGRLGGMPRVLAFQSIVDATVTAREVVRGLLAQLPQGGHELVVFDINRRDTFEGLVAPGPIADLENIRAATGLPFRLTLIANRDATTNAIAMYTREAGASEVKVEPLALEWPRGVFSLGHVALPFPPDDPVYGLEPRPGAGPAYPLGAVSVRGEEGALLVPLGALARLKCNPFFDVIRTKVEATLTGEAAQGP
jgi:alpha-beta hydrolase superfamily lysophospholipase